MGGLRRSVEAGSAKARQRRATGGDTPQHPGATGHRLPATQRGNRQLRQLSANEQALADTLKLTRNQYQAGIVSDANVAQAESQWQSAQAQRADKQPTRAQLEHAIAAALGQTPASFSLAAADAEPRLPNIPAGLPSQLLERRPDIAAAERAVAQANAEIGIAQAAFFPTLTLSASGGYRGASFADWVSLPNRVWSLGPALALSLFDGGLRSAQKEQAIASYDASVAGYRLAVLSAFQGVEDNLAAQSCWRKKPPRNRPRWTPAARRNHHPQPIPRRHRQLPQPADRAKQPHQCGNHPVECEKPAIRRQRGADRRAGRRLAGLHPASRQDHALNQEAAPPQTKPGN